MQTLQQKYTLLEGGVRGTAVAFSTLFENYPSINNELMHISDLFPTFYAAAGNILMPQKICTLCLLIPRWKCLRFRIN